MPVVKESVHLETPFEKEKVKALRAGDIVYITGVVYTARDLAHLRMQSYLRQNKVFPFDLKGYAVYHSGPNAIRKGDMWTIDSLGPTTSIRMEPFSSMIGRLGVNMIIGKGGMGEKTQEALVRYNIAYLCAPPGCGVLGARAIRGVLDVYWLDLGIPEAVWKLAVEKWGPLIVAMDSHGGNLFQIAVKEAKRRLAEMSLDV